MKNDSFNRPAPPGFRGLQADLPLRVYERRLPHWRQTGATYFVTFRLADSIPQTHLRALKHWRMIWEREHPEPRSDADWEALARAITTKTERWLDEGFGACELGQPRVATLIRESLGRFQDDRYFISCYAVMPNHVHIVMKPLGAYELEVLLKNLKGFTARRINAELRRQGRLWEEESYDRIVRDEEHLYRVVQYIGRNPLKAGLTESRWQRWIDPRWIAAGWTFEIG